MRFSMDGQLCVLIVLIGTVGVHAEGEMMQPPPTENSYWEKTKDLYEQGLLRGEEFFRRSTNDTWKIIGRLYERAKVNGEDVPKDVMEWAKQDIRKIGAWEYKVVELHAADASEIETELNKYGRLRWQCYWVEDVNDGKRFYLKKAGRSYLKIIPAGDLLKLVPPGAEQ